MQSYRAISFCCHPAALSLPAAQCTTSPPPRTRDLRYHRPSLPRAPFRCASTTSAHTWPTPPSGHTNPTPYQILSLQRSSPYSKARFYELVKLYHPDRTCASGLTPATRLERYRLIVAAHTLLSDPAKRSAYDRYGAGWDGRKDRGVNFNAQAAPFTPRGDIWANATWEDWEAWRERHAPPGGEQQGPVYMRNGNFIAAVMVLAALGASWNLSRAEENGQRFLAARDKVHDDAARELRRVRQQSGHRPKEERIDWFLKNREAAMGVGVDEVREERARRVLGEEGRCGLEE